MITFIRHTFEVLSIIKAAILGAPQTAFTHSGGLLFEEVASGAYRGIRRRLKDSGTFSADQAHN